MLQDERDLYAQIYMDSKSNTLHFQIPKIH